MKKKHSFKQITISLCIAFLSLNLGIGVANSAMQNTKDYYQGNPANQTIVSLSSSFENKSISINNIKKSIEIISANCDVVVGPYPLLEIDNSINKKEVTSFFVTNNFKSIPQIKDGNFIDRKDFSGGHVVLGKDFLKTIEDNTTLNNSLNIRNEDFSLDGVAFSTADFERINSSIFLSIADMDKIIKEPYIYNEPFYLDIIINGKNSDKNADILINDLEQNSNLFVNKKHLSSEYKQSIKPSSYIISSFSIFILLLSIINIWLLTNIVIEDNYRNFAIMKSIGAYESLIAVNFLKKLFVRILLSSFLGYLIFVIISGYLSSLLNLNIYNGINNLLLTLLVSILSSLFAAIPSYYKIKKLDLVKFLKR